ncbi:hypothetical protein [Caenibius sp. WL]|uniref:hypothetical protein n=1 Tax=Caenibius sp. WL TaxID=2872646 RepID=UPI001C99853D|nr:hypothetical protein [Caenibius sp. WL]QZP07656.1 hypothetical protein K5X80_13465 [Caenibius sp. WL]
MTSGYSRKSGSFSAFSSSLEEYQKNIRNSVATATQKAADEANQVLEGANAQPSEVTRLERRVLAHERILQALVCDLADDDPEILTRLKLRFGGGHDLGNHEQNYVSTRQFGEYFIHAVEAEMAKRH